MAAFNRAFLTGAAGVGNYRANTAGGWADFWKEAEMIEMAEDAYQRAGSPAYLRLVVELHDGFVLRFGSDWSLNAYNDDIIWMCLACIRAYELTGNTGFLNQAKANFDRVWSRGFDGTLGGGLWWNTSRGEKNTCITMPAAIMAYKLSVDLGDPSYLEKARALLAWQKDNLYDKATGRVYDNERRDGVVDRTAYTYNAGTFIGAASFLGDVASARKALDYAREHLTVDGILKSEHATHDQGGFKGIFCRWAYRFVRDEGLGSQYDPWFQRNVDAALARQDSRGLMDQDWSAATGSGILDSWSCSSAVVLLQVTGVAETIVDLWPAEPPAGRPAHR